MMQYLTQTILLAVCLAVLPVLSLVAQVTVGNEALGKTLYLRGLQACLEKEITAYSKFSDRDLRKVNVAYNFDLTRDLPTELGEINLQYLSDYELAEKYKALPKAERERGIPFIKIFPLSDKEDKLIFAYNNYWFRYSEKGGFFTRKKITFSWSLEGGCHAEIEFDPLQKKFVIKKVNLWGV